LDLASVIFVQLDCKAVATRQIRDMYKPKPNPYLNANPNANP